MADETELKIVVVDGGSAPSLTAGAMVPTPAGVGTMTGAGGGSLLDPLRDVLKQLTDELKRQREETTEAASKTAEAAAAAKMPRTFETGLRAMQAFTTGIQLATAAIQAETSYRATLSAGGSFLMAEVARIRAAGSLWGSAIKWGGTLAGAGVALFPVPGARAVGGAIAATSQAAGSYTQALSDNHAAQLEAFEQGRINLRQRAAYLAQFGGPAAVASAAAENRHLRRDLQEAHDLGPAYGRFLDRDNEFEVLERQLQAVIRLQDLQKHEAERAKELREMTRKLNEGMASLNEAAQEIVRNLAKPQSDPLKELLKGATVPDDPLVEAERALDKLMQQAANEPLFNDR